MDNEVTPDTLQQEAESTIKKPWQPPAVEVLPVEETQGDFIAVTDGTSFFS